MDTLRILLVDDDPKALDRMLEAIRGNGLSYEARIARGAFEALDYLLGRGRYHERRRHPLPDLILLSYDMAPMDGLAVLRRIRQLEFVRCIPVVLVCKSAVEIERAMQQPMRPRAYTLQPLTPESFQAALREAGLVRNTAGPWRASGGSA